MFVVDVGGSFVPGNKDAVGWCGAVGVTAGAGRPPPLLLLLSSCCPLTPFVLWLLQAGLTGWRLNKKVACGMVMVMWLCAYVGVDGVGRYADRGMRLSARVMFD